jgi:sugar phosphate isomerase/epimerase
MKYAFCNEMFEDEPFPRAWAAMRALGYTGVELAPFTLLPTRTPFDVRDVSRERRSEVKQQAADAGLEIVGLHWLLAHTQGVHLTSPDPAVRRATADYLKALAELCGDLGGKVLVLGSPQQRSLLPGVGYDEAEAFAVDVLQAAMPTYAERGVMLALEPLSPADTDFMLTAVSAIRLAELVDSPHCKLHLDAKALSFEAVPPDVVIRDSRKWLVHFHVNDANGLGPGMGKVEFGPILTALADINYQGWLSLEVFDYKPSPREIGQRSIEYLRKIEAAIASEPPL